MNLTLTLDQNLDQNLEAGKHVIDLLPKVHLVQATSSVLQCYVEL